MDNFLALRLEVRENAEKEWNVEERKSLPEKLDFCNSSQYCDWPIVGHAYRIRVGKV